MMDGPVDDVPEENMVESDEESDEEMEGSQFELLALRLEAMREAGTLPAYLIDTPTPSELSSFDETGVAQFILENISGEDIVVLGGAGMSTSAGIPDFRSPGTGLYDNLQKYNLPRPQAIFELEYFRERPQAFYELARELWPGGYAPTPTHCFIKLLYDKGRLLRCFTQNIDSLETAAGVPAEKIVAAHGNFDSATCITTGEPVPINQVKDAVLSGPQGWINLKNRYGGLVKPDIVFFGEGLPRRFFDLANDDLARARLLLVIGTSLSVQPFASLINHVNDTCIRVLINRDPVGLRDSRIPLLIAKQLGLGGFDFHDARRNYRDVALLGNCDDQIYRLADALGWRQDLDHLVSHARHQFAHVLARETATVLNGNAPPQVSSLSPASSSRPHSNNDDYYEENESQHDQDTNAFPPLPPSPAMPPLPPLAMAPARSLDSSGSSDAAHHMHHSSSFQSNMTQSTLDRPHSAATIDEPPSSNFDFAVVGNARRHSASDEFANRLRHSQSHGAFLTDRQKNNESFLSTATTNSSEPITRMNRSYSQQARVNYLSSEQEDILLPIHDQDMRPDLVTNLPPRPPARAPASSPFIPHVTSFQEDQK
uniref:Deacetylase sirtuin-type domain-containing protein n=1 Tax=Aureoumbra lagunensis TaxID=44058 RepID=A0A7S3K0N6_9STRA|mmetsp:Transcript_20965/g.27191  ORF Transcript_20965/g.27191 Transcript_20965/m.27191 type:complete len:598 (-) Transcript_20965:230-2023(-)